MNAALSRRQFLSGVAAVAVAPALPVPAVPVVAGLDVAASPSWTMWAVGTPGEFDWMGIAAQSAEDALDRWLAARGVPPEESSHDPGEFVQRVTVWDSIGPEGLGAQEWFNAGLGYTCDGCQEGTSPDEGAIIVDGCAYCEFCQSIGQRAGVDPDAVVEELAGEIAVSDEAVVRSRLERHGDWDEIPAEIWTRACAEGGAA